MKGKSSHAEEQLKYSDVSFVPLLHAIPLIEVQSQQEKKSKNAEEPVASRYINDSYQQKLFSS